MRDSKKKEKERTATKEHRTVKHDFALNRDRRGKKKNHYERSLPRSRGRGTDQSSSLRPEHDGQLQSDNKSEHWRTQKGKREEKKKKSRLKTNLVKRRLEVEIW